MDNIEKKEHLKTLLLQVEETKFNKQINDLNTYNIKNMNLKQKTNNISYNENPINKHNMDEEYLKIMIEKEYINILNKMSLTIIIIDKAGELKTLNVKNYCEQELYKIGFEFLDNIPQYKINKEVSIQWYQDENFITVYNNEEWVQMTNVDTIDKTKQLIKELCRKK